MFAGCLGASSSLCCCRCCSTLEIPCQQWGLRYPHGTHRPIKRHKLLQSSIAIGSSVYQNSGCTSRAVRRIVGNCQDSHAMDEAPGSLHLPVTVMRWKPPLETSVVCAGRMVSFRAKEMFFQNSKSVIQASIRLRSISGMPRGCATNHARLVRLIQ
jgi:hypothetical protein